MMSLEAHPGATRRRIARFRRYMDAHVLGPDRFVCPRFSECRKSRREGDHFFQGQLSHVGHRYDLSLDGRPLRIVVVGQEYAFNSIVDGRLKRRRVTLDERYRMLQVSGLERRYFATSEYPSRNPHMRGTTQALRLLFGSGLGSDYEREWIEPAEGRTFHIFDGFALVNRLLCAAGLPGDGQGRSTRTMRANCLEHFNAWLEILEPTVLILQGEGVQSWTVDALSNEEPVTPPYLSWAQHAGGEALVCRFSHPSARGDKRWGDRIDAPYLLKVVRPTMRAVRRRL